MYAAVANGESGARGLGIMTGIAGVAWQGSTYARLALK